MSPGLATAGLLAFGLGLPKAVPPSNLTCQPEDSPPVVSFGLANGLRVAVQADRSVADVYVELWFRAGSAYERNEESGLAHLFEHAFPPARHLLADPAVAARARRAVLDSNAQTRPDSTRFFVRVPATSIELALALLSERARSVEDALTADALEGHRRTVLREFDGTAERWWSPLLTAPAAPEALVVGPPVATVWIIAGDPAALPESWRAPETGR